MRRSIIYHHQISTRSPSSIRETLTGAIFQLEALLNVIQAALVMPPFSTKLSPDGHIDQRVIRMTDWIAMLRLMMAVVETQNFASLQGTANP